LTRQEAEDFLYREARLLDERRLEEWLEMFTQDGMYWIPMDENADPDREPSIAYDDSFTRAQRVYQLLNQPHYSQVPRTVHLITNVEVEAGSNAEESIVRCALALFEVRSGDERQFGLGMERSFAGRCEYHLLYDRDRWRIKLKKVVLTGRDLPLENFTFIV
jgi:3-phenylpropionate/cinnamic acid dioxygenase small subunit